MQAAEDDGDAALACDLHRLDRVAEASGEVALTVAMCLGQLEQRADRAVWGDLTDALRFADQEGPVGEARQVPRQGPRPAAMAGPPV